MAIPPMNDHMYVRAHTDSESTLSAEENLNVDGKLEEDMINDQGSESGVSEDIFAANATGRCYCNDLYRLTSTALTMFVWKCTCFNFSFMQESEHVHLHGIM